MFREQEYKVTVSRWFDGFWGNSWNPGIIDELAAADMLLQYSLHAPCRGREDVRDFMMGFRAAFPDLNFWGAADLIAEGDYVVGRWEGGGTHTGPAFSDFLGTQRLFHRTSFARDELVDQVDLADVFLING